MGCCTSKADLRGDSLHPLKGEEKSFHGLDDKLKGNVIQHKPSPSPQFTKDAKIIIVGGGPAGIHMGHLLKEHGYTNVIILEKNERVGGKSYTIYHEENGYTVPHEMGTCFMHQGYKRTMDLIEKFNVGPYLKTGGDHYDKCNVYSPKLAQLKIEDPAEPYKINEWMFSESEIRATPNYLWSVLPDAGQSLTLVESIAKYSSVHKNIFGEYEYSIPPRPKDEATLKLFNMTFGEFIVGHKLEALIPIFTLSNAAQGYGYLQNVPAFYGLWWNTPAMLSAITERKTLTMMLQKGFLAIWKAIVDEQKLDVRLNANVTQIVRHLDDPQKKVVVKAVVNGKEEEFEGDFLIISSPLKHAVNEFLADVTPDEKRLFGNLLASSLTSTLFRCPILRPDERATSYYPERLNLDWDGRLYAERNSARAVFFDRDQDPKYRIAVAYQYYDVYQPGREETAKKQLESDLKELGYHDIEFLAQYVSEYFPHYNQEEINKFYPWEILDLQGKNKTWYAGSSACFESVEDVVSYNHLLLKLYLQTDDSERK